MDAEHDKAWFLLENAPSKRAGLISTGAMLHSSRHLCTRSIVLLVHIFCLDMTPSLGTTSALGPMCPYSAWTRRPPASGGAPRDRILRGHDVSLDTASALGRPVCTYSAWT